MNKNIAKVIVFVLLLATLIIAPTSIFANEYEMDSNPSPISVKDSGVIIVTTKIQGGNNLEGLDVKILKNGQILKFDKYNNAYEQSNSGSYTTLTSDSMGEIRVEGLSSGTYTIEGIKTGDYDPQSSQTVSLSSNGTQTATLSYENASGSIEVSVKEETGAIIEGASFKVFNSVGAPVSFTSGESYKYSGVNSGSDILVSNSLGIIKIEGLPYGSYKIQQIGFAPDFGGEMEIKTVNISSSSKSNISFVNTSAHGNLKVIFNEKGNENAFVGGSKISISNPSTSTSLKFSSPTENTFSFDNNSQISEITIPENGVVYFKDIPLGSYNVTEISTNEKYSSSPATSFSIERDKESTVNFAKEPLSGSILIKLINSQDNTSVSGGIYNIKNNSGKIVKFSKNESSFELNAKGDIVDIEPNKDGSIKLSKLPIEEFTIIQKESPSGFLINPEEYKQSVSPNSEAILTVPLTISNSAITVMNVDNMPIENVKVEVYTDSATLMSGQTNSNGKFLVYDIPKGDYKYKIVGVTSGYSIPKENEFSFKMFDDGKSEGLSSIQIPYSEIKVSIGERQNDLPMNGAKFSLKNEAGEVIESESDNSGIAIFSKIPYGKYILEQTTSPDGYLKSEKVEEIIVGETFSNPSTFMLDNGIVEDSSPILVAENIDSSTSPNSPILSILNKYKFVIMGIIAFLVIAFTIFTSIKSGEVIKPDKKDKTNDFPDIKIKKSNKSSKNNVTIPEKVPVENFEIQKNSTEIIEDNNSNFSSWMEKDFDKKGNEDGNIPPHSFEFVPNELDNIQKTETEDSKSEEKIDKTIENKITLINTDNGLKTKEDENTDEVFDFSLETDI